MRNRPKVSRVAAALALVAALLVINVAPAASQANLPPIRIGTIGAYSGPQSASFAPIKDAVQAWAKSVNDGGGIGGRKIELFVGDDVGDAAKSRTLLRDFVEKKKVVALVGTGSSGTDQGWGDYLQDKGVPVVGGSASSPVWQTNPMFFAANATNAAAFYAYMKQASKRGYERAAVAYCSELAVCASVINVLRAQSAHAGVKIVGQFPVSATAADYSNVCLQMKRTDAEVVILPLSTTVAIRFARACSAQGFKPAYSLSGATMTDDMLRMPEFDDAMGFERTFSPVVKQAAAYRAAMKKYTKTSHISSGTLGWTGAKLFEKALAKVPARGAVTSRHILNGLNSIRNETLGGLLVSPLTFEAGKPHPQIKCVTTTVIRNGRMASNIQDKICAP